jgi:monoamine oxidase
VKPAQLSLLFHVQQYAISRDLTESGVELLPAPLAGAVARLQYGTIAKTPVQYGERFWLKQGVSGDTVTDLPIGTTWDATNAQPGRRGILMTYGAAAGVPEAIDGVDRVYPGSAATAITGASIHWSDEPYSGGSYSAYAPGQMTRYYAALRKPVGRMFLAGEHTDDFAGYMEGAVRSGRRAAAAVGRAA